MGDQFAADFLVDLWFDGTWRQWSGYILLGLSGAALLTVLLMKVRPIVRLGGYNWWRLAHVTLGIASLLAVFAHTGFRLGTSLNAALMGCFLAALIFGGLAGIFSNAAGALRRMGISPQVRAIPMQLHLIALCPLPALLIVHVLVVYLY